jgi:serine/threonine protein kinase
MSLRKFWLTRSLQFRRPPTPRTLPTILPADVLIEEERIPGYNPKNFYPVNPGDLLNNRYRILSKIGWGTTSTVWLAQDTQRCVLWYYGTSSTRSVFLLNPL